jgi:hypothetical protein
MRYRSLDLTTVVFVHECEVEVLRFLGTDVMAMVHLVKAVVGNRRDQTDTSWRSGPAAVDG